MNKKFWLKDSLTSRNSRRVSDSVDFDDNQVVVDALNAMFDGAVFTDSDELVQKALKNSISGLDIVNVISKVDFRKESLHALLEGGDIVIMFTSNGLDSHVSFKTNNVLVLCAVIDCSINTSFAYFDFYAQCLSYYANK